MPSGSCRKASTNSAGTLVLHLTGNMQHFFGAQLGGTGYVRDRAAEFAARGVPRAALLADTSRPRAAPCGPPRRRSATPPSGRTFRRSSAACGSTTGEYLVHLVSHFAYHLGQVDYHRRIVTRDRRGVDAVRAAELAVRSPGRRLRPGATDDVLDAQGPALLAALPARAADRLRHQASRGDCTWCPRRCPTSCSARWCGSPSPTIPAPR